MNGDGIPEVVIKAYADNTVQKINGDVMAIIDGRSEGLPVQAPASIRHSGH